MTWRGFINTRKAEGAKRGLWVCSKCGIIGRLEHRYLSGDNRNPHAAITWGEPMDPGPCNQERIIRIKQSL